MKKEKEIILDTDVLAKALTGFAEETVIFHEENTLTEKNLPCSKVWSVFTNDTGEKIILCTKVTETEEKMREISIYAFINGKIHAIIGLYDEVNDFYYPKKIKKNYDVNKIGEFVKKAWNKITKNGA